MKAQLLCLALLVTACATAKTSEAPKSAPAQAAQGQNPGPSALELTAQAEAERSGGVERIFSIVPAPSQPGIGGAGAKVKVEVCSDFECPFCARMVPTVHELAENYGDLVRIVWRNCPLPFHEHALPAA